MTPAEIRDATIHQLRDTFLAMTSPEFLLDLDTATAAQRKDAARKLIMVQHARLSLDNEELVDMRDNLKANEADLETGRDQVGEALQDLKDVAAVLTAVGDLLDIVSKVVPLLL
ncbi:MAG: hypothetical protein HYR85_08375 [Planctomycetes bacterium]|nr:hypothetical protein [Planctomycetota bacterium]MBI3845308.1 hypothetical protein [Planctomycetota bacterium]